LWPNFNNEEGRKKYRSLKNELKRATGKVKRECLESMFEEITEFQRAGPYDLMYMKTQELG
jgi:hypothetical protein